MSVHLLHSRFVLFSRAKVSVAGVSRRRVSLTCVLVVKSYDADSCGASVRLFCLDDNMQVGIAVNNCLKLPGRGCGFCELGP